jgi:hypothetical protein
MPANIQSAAYGIESVKKGENFMPKDPPRNQPNYKIGGDHINEYEYQQHKGQMTEEETELPPAQEKLEDADLLNETEEELINRGGEDSAG